MSGLISIGGNGTSGLLTLILGLATGASMPQGMLSVRRDAGSLLLAGELRRMTDQQQNRALHLSPFVAVGTRWNFVKL